MFDNEWEKNDNNNLTFSLKLLLFISYLKKNIN